MLTSTPASRLNQIAQPLGILYRFNQSEIESRLRKIVERHRPDPTLIALDGLDQLPKLARQRATLLVIAEAAARLRALAGANAVAYLGSGRFLLFCDDFLRVDELVEHAVDTVAKLSGRYDLDGAGSPNIRALGGVALGPVESASSTVLLEQASSALGEAYREADAVHVYRRRSARPIASINELRDGLHNALQTNALFPRYSLVIDIATRQPVAIRVEPVWESAQFGRVDPLMIDQVAADMVTRRWLSDLVVGRLLPEAWPVAGPADLSLDASLLDLADAGLRTKLAAAAAAARATRTGIEVVVDTPIAEGQPSAAALDLAGPAILVALRGAAAIEGDDQLHQPIASVWLPAAAADPAGAIAHAKATFPHLRRIVADGVEDLGTLDRLAALGFTAFAGLPPLTQITADEAIAFTQPDKSRRSNGQSRIAS